MGEPHPSDLDGDIQQSCKNCGEKYNISSDGSEGGRCPECTEEISGLDFLSGTMRVRDEDVRERVVSTLETEFGVWVDERVGDVKLYDPETSER